MANTAPATLVNDEEAARPLEYASDNSTETAAVEEESHSDSFLFGWDGDGSNDPMCPRSFSKAKKWIIVLVISLATFCVTSASSMFSSTYGNLESEFGNTRIVSTLGLSLFVLGLALGPMLFGPLSEFYGRRPIYIIGWTMYIIWFIPQAVATNIATIIVCRFLNGFSGSVFLAVAGGTTGDLFAREELQWPMAIFSAAPFVGPCIGPLIGGFINYHTSWRWSFWVFLIWSGLLFLALIFLVPETYHPVLLTRKAEKMRAETGEDRWHSATERNRGEKGQAQGTNTSILHAVGISLLRPFQLLFFEPMCFFLCTYTAILLGILYLFFGAFPLVFSNVYGWELDMIGLTFLGIGLGVLVGLFTDPIWKRVRAGLLVKLEQETGVKGASEPEFRLPPAILGSFAVTAGIFIFAWTSVAWVHWIVPLIGSAIFGFGTILVFTSIFTFLVDAYPNYAASALAANTLYRCAFAAAFPLFGNQMYTKVGYQWGSSILAFLTVAMLPFPYIFFKYGKAIRKSSRYAKR